MPKAQVTKSTIPLAMIVPLILLVLLVVISMKYVHMRNALRDYVMKTSNQSMLNDSKSAKDQAELIATTIAIAPFVIILFLLKAKLFRSI